jgi:hypothetical protein
MHNDPRYAVINNGRPYPPLTRNEAHEFATKLLRAFGDPKECAVRSDMVGNTERTWDATRGELDRIYYRWVGGNRGSATLGRKCWAATKPTTGHFKGWGRLIHDVSHMVHRYRHPKARPHAHGHEAIELAVMRYVEAHGWLIEEPKTRDNSHKMLALQERILRWESKERRAKNALKKLRARLNRLNKAQAKVLVQS